MFTKTIKRSDDCYIQFSEEEMKSLGIEPGDKFSWKDNKDGSFTLEKHVKIDINLSEFSREILEYIVTTSLENDSTVEETIVDLITSALEHFSDEY